MMFNDSTKSLQIGSIKWTMVQDNDASHGPILNVPANYGRLKTSGHIGSVVHCDRVSLTSWDNTLCSVCLRGGSYVRVSGGETGRARHAYIIRRRRAQHNAREAAGHAARSAINESEPQRKVHVRSCVQRNHARPCDRSRCDTVGAERDRHAELDRRYARPGRAAGSSCTRWIVYIAPAVLARDRGKVL
jgi:hypothetical protein